MENGSHVDYKELLGQSRIADIYHYPIKSCAGIRSNRAVVGPTGIEHDRELMLVSPDGTFISQRVRGGGRLALIQPAIHNGILTVEAPNMPDLFMPISYDGERISATIHNVPGTLTVDQGRDAHIWFSEFLGFDCRLVAMDPEHKRLVDEAYALSPDDHTTFADGFSTLVISQESLDDLNRRLPRPLSMDRFRPNLVLSGSQMGYGEDRLQRFQAGDVTFTTAKPCSRCPITTIDQEIGEIDREDGMAGEPLRTLLKYRAKMRMKRGELTKEALFGQNLVHENTGTISVGDQIKVLSTQEPPELLEEAA